MKTQGAADCGFQAVPGTLSHVCAHARVGRASTQPSRPKGADPGS